MHTPTCNGCATDGACDIQKEKRAALRGLGITSAKFVCRDRADVFLPGEPVIFTTYVADDYDERGGSVQVSYRGYCIKQTGTKIFGFIKPGEEDVGGEGIPFEPRSNGFVKMTMKRVRKDSSRSIADLSFCGQCGAYAGLGQCFKETYTPVGSCAAEMSRTALNHKDQA